MELDNILVVAGPSCSGKSSACRVVADAVGAEIVTVDGFWIRGSDKPLVNGHPSFERPAQYDGAAAAARVRELRRSKPAEPIVVEGFLALRYPEILALGGVRIFLDIPHRVLLARRRARAAAGPNAHVLGLNPECEIAWEANGEDEWRDHGAPQKLAPGVVILNAEVATEVLAERILKAWTG